MFDCCISYRTYQGHDFYKNDVVPVKHCFIVKDNTLTKKGADFRMQETNRSCGLQIPVIPAGFPTG